MSPLKIEYLIEQYDSIIDYWIESPKPGVAIVTFFVHEPKYYADLLEGLNIKWHIEHYKPIGIMIDIKIVFVEKDFKF